MAMGRRDRQGQQEPGERLYRWNIAYLGNIRGDDVIRPLDFHAVPRVINYNVVSFFERL